MKRDVKRDGKRDGKRHLGLVVALVTLAPTALATTALATTLLATTVLATRALAADERGTVIAIGGGKLGDRVLDRIVALARGKEGGRIVVCPAASGHVEGPEVERFHERGATAVELVDFRSRAEADGVAAVASLESARAIFFTGGDQARLLATLAGSRALEAMRVAFRRGAVIAGTSAGCAVLGELAIEGDGEGEPLRGGAGPRVVAGLGFVRGALLDQHFLARHRESRLVAALLAHPTLVGLGIDEGLAVEVPPSGASVVLGGTGYVSVYRPSGGKRFALELVAPGETLELP